MMTLYEYETTSKNLGSSTGGVGSSSSSRSRVQREMDDDVAEQRQTNDGVAELVLPTSVRVIHVHCIGCLLHVLHLAVNAGMESVFFMGTLPKGSWHEWPRQHLVGLLGSLWYNTSKSDVSNTSWKQYQHLIKGKFGIAWNGKFHRPSETRWMVAWKAAIVLESRWPQVQWLASEWAPSTLLGNPFLNYWYKHYVMLQNLLMRVHCKFAAALAEEVLFWAYHWLRGKGGYFLKRDDKVERLPPGMRLAETPEFCLEFVRRLEELRSKPRHYFESVLEFAEKHLHPDELNHFMQNFSEDSSSGFFKEAEKRWSKWADQYQHLPYSVARIGCSSFYRGKWAGEETAAEYAAGQEFARGFLAVLWSDRYTWLPRTELERTFRETLIEDLAQAEATTVEEKHRLTLGLFSKVNEDGAFRVELEQYAESAYGQREVVEGDGEEANPMVRTSAFRQIWEFPLLYQWACFLIYIVPIQQQLVERFFSKYDSCSRQYDSKELDLVRTGQYRSAESVPIRRLKATSKEIREAGDRGISVARALREAACAAEPCAWNHRKREHDVSAYLAKLSTQKQGTPWVALPPAEDSSDSNGESSRSEVSSSSDVESNADEC